MSVWRNKRRYEENRRFSERADAALLAVGILQNSADGIETSRSDEDLQENIAEGRELLEELRRALEAPEQVDDSTFALAHKLCNSWKLVPEDAVERLATDVGTLRTAEETVSTVHGLNKVEETLSDIEEIAGRISEAEAQQMRNNIVN
jgi:hypothetical protein